MDARTLTAAIGAELGDGWSVNADFPADADGGMLTGPAGEQLHLALSRYNHRLIATGAFSYEQHSQIQRRVRRQRGRRPHLRGRERETYEITVKIDTPPDKIADHIQRRLLPDYRAMLAEVTERVAGTVAAEAAQAELCDRLAAILPGGQPLRWDGRITFNLPDSNSTGDAQAQHGGGLVRFEMTLPTAHGLEVAALLRRLVDNGKAHQE